MNHRCPTWMQTALLFAAIYNVTWGAWVILDPERSLRICGYPEPLPYPQLWQCLGMIVGVYGVSYGIAARNPHRHWPIVFVGLLGKVLGPAGLVWNIWRGTLPVSAAKLCLFNDIIWWIPFAWILRDAWRYEMSQSAGTPSQPSFKDAINSVRSNTGQTLAELSAQQPLLVVFLRHAGCTFCREALSDVAKVQKQIADSGTGIAFVHMSEPTREAAIFTPYGLQHLPRFSDPEQILYRAFELKNGRLSQLLGPSVFWEGVKAAVLRGHGLGLIEGNSLRMPGVFLLKHGQIVAANRLQTAADRPDYAGMVCDATGA